MQTEREVLDGMIDAVRERLEQLELDVAFEQRYLADLIERRKKMSPVVPKARKKKRIRPVLAKGAIEPGSLTEQIIKVLEDHGATMRAADIAREVVVRGATTSSKGGMLPMVNTSLSRRKNMFEKVGRGLYKLRKTTGAAEEP